MTSTPPTTGTARGGPAATYERHFVPTIAEPLARDLIDRAAPRAGERVLDVACGTGILARLAARRVGDPALVIGVDVLPEMLTVAAEVGPDGIDWREGRAEALPVEDGAADVALCQLGLQFFADRTAALAEMRRALRDDGRVAINVPGPMPRPFVPFAEALGRHAGPDAAGFGRAVFGLHDRDELRALLEGAGFRDAETIRSVAHLALPPAEAFLWQYVSSTPLAPLVLGLDDRRREALRDEVVAAWEPFGDGDGMAIDLEMTTAIGRA